MNHAGYFLLGLGTGFLLGLLLCLAATPALAGHTADRDLVWEPSIVWDGPTVTADTTFELDGLVRVCTLGYPAVCSCYRRDSVGGDTVPCPETITLCGPCLCWVLMTEGSNDVTGGEWRGGVCDVRRSQPRREE